MPPFRDPVEELPSAAELHHYVDGDGILVGAFDRDDVLVAGEVVEDLDLSPHVLQILPLQQLPLGDGFAGVVFAGFPLGAEECGSELAVAELIPQIEALFQVPCFGSEHGIDLEAHAHLPLHRFRVLRPRVLRHDHEHVLRLGIFWRFSGVVAADDYWLDFVGIHNFVLDLHQFWRIDVIRVEILSTIIAAAAAAIIVLGSNHVRLRRFRRP